MADNKYYVTAGLPIHKDSGQSPGAGENTYYVTAGLPKVTEAAPGGYVPYPTSRGLRGGLHNLSGGLG